MPPDKILFMCTKDHQLSLGKRLRKKFSLFLSFAFVNGWLVFSAIVVPFTYRLSNMKTN